MPALSPWMVKLGAAAIGGVLGFAYYKFVGCSTGACPLTSSPYTSTLYGALVGWLMVADKP
jgi:hypothetical protein